jgi:hypothetical protein
MMRKLIWCGAAAGVLLAGGLYTAWQHARSHPDSLAGRCLVGASGAAIFLNPLVGAGPLLEHAVHHWRAEGGSEECVEIAPGDEARWHEEPVCVGQEGEHVEVAKLDVAGAMELPAAEPPAGPAPIVIPEDDPPPAAVAEEDGNVAPVATPNATIEMDAEAALPAVMPYCEDGRAPAPGRMPYADEGAEPTGAADARPAPSKRECLAAYFKKLFQKHAAPSATTEAEEDSGTKGEGEADYHRYHHHTGCPANYCPYTGRCYPEPASPPCLKKSHGGAEDSEAPAKPGKGCDKGEGCPKHPEVDTMEYRKSDGRLDDYGPGGPF